jgi:hypothetical protein
LESLKEHFYLMQHEKKQVKIQECYSFYLFLFL